MPCPIPTLVDVLRLYLKAMAPRRAKVAMACALGLALAPAATHRRPKQETPPESAGLIHLGPDDAALSAGKLPAVFPPEWRSPPCPKAKSVVEIRHGAQRACFAVLAETPPCTLGFEDDTGTRCVMALTKMERTPSSIGR